MVFQYSSISVPEFQSLSRLFHSAEPLYVMYFFLARMNSFVSSNYICVNVYEIVIGLILVRYHNNICVRILLMSLNMFFSQRFPFIRSQKSQVGVFQFRSNMILAALTCMGLYFMNSIRSYHRLLKDKFLYHKNLVKLLLQKIQGF